MRTSFTGELGFEINVPSGQVVALWQKLIDVGTKMNITPFGIEALMVMRTEKGYIHVGADTDSSTIPADIGFGRVAQNKQANFICKRSLYRPQELRTDREVLVGLQSANQQKLPTGAMIFADGHFAAPAPMQGRVTSSYDSPTLGRPVALGLLQNGADRLGETVRLYDASGLYEAKIVPVCALDPKAERLHV